ncbi:hypothetical protein SAMN02910456_01351 [Ruminococcaceae bacterium YRB3002]|nr:hypothetical protein SAMN02910456_01351 [Ruminococcaceae bacterium YRB3002]
MFRSANGQEVTMDGIIDRITRYIAEEPHAAYEITVGTDSQSHGQTKMVEVIAVHRRGNGGIYFYNIEFVRRISNLKQKINEETARSLSIANGLIDRLELALLERDIDIASLDISFQIHCDIGRYGKTSMLIKEITSWVTSYGYVCMIKPDSYTASGIANKYSK